MHEKSHNKRFMFVACGHPTRNPLRALLAA
jgi:hypothetical protein